jgi:hypothetical protein
VPVWYSEPGTLQSTLPMIPDYPYSVRRSEVSLSGIPRRVKVTWEVACLEVSGRVVGGRRAKRLPSGVLEAAAVAAFHPPAAVCALNEAGFEAAARECHRRLGAASPAALNQMLAEFGF